MDDYGPCPKCGANMEFGFIADGTYGEHSERFPVWIRGIPDRTVFTQRFKAGPRDRIQVTTLRCVGCGYLECYAPPPLDTPGRTPTQPPPSGTD